ncbi:MAG: helix-turn-helix domain-containing protein [Parvularcula sp.]
MQLHFYKELEPIPAARRYIRRLIYCDCNVPVTLDVPAPPTGYNHIGWAMRGEGGKQTCHGFMPVAEGEVHFAGQTVKSAARVVLRGRVRHMLAELTPIGLYAGFGLVAEPFVNRVNGANAVGLSALQHALRWVDPETEIEEALVLYQRALVDMFVGAEVPGYVAWAADAIEESQGLVDMATLPRGVCERQLQRGFKRIVGCSPKHFSQVLRVNATVLSLVERQDETLASIAADHGFADQPHMVRSIRSFFGLAPSQIRDNVDGLLRAFPTNGGAQDESDSWVA